MSELYRTIQATTRTLVASWSLDFNGPEVRADTYESEYGDQMTTEYGSDNERNVKVAKFLCQTQKQLLDQIIDLECCKSWAWYKLEERQEAVDLANEQVKTMDVLFMIDLSKDGTQVLKCKTYLDHDLVETYWPSPRTGVESALFGISHSGSFGSASAKKDATASSTYFDSADAYGPLSNTAKPKATSSPFGFADAAASFASATNTTWEDESETSEDAAFSAGHSPSDNRPAWARKSGTRREDNINNFDKC